MHDASGNRSVSQIVQVFIPPISGHPVKQLRHNNILRETVLLVHLSAHLSALSHVLQMFDAFQTQYSFQSDA